MTAPQTQGTPPAVATPGESEIPAAITRRWRTDNPLTLGVAALWLTVIVLLPLAAITTGAFDDGWSGFWEAISAPAATVATNTTMVRALPAGSVLTMPGLAPNATQAMGCGSTPSAATVMALTPAAIPLVSASIV